MRIPNIVPMLLLACSLAAQNSPCHIYDLTANVVDCVNGQFYVVLDFQHDNTGDLFRVQGNGVVYDTFSYSQAPVTIGPLPADGTTNYEFIVRDLMYPDCQDDVKVGPVTCPSSGPCEIYDLAVSTGDCTSDSTYLLKLNFKVANSTDDQLDLWGNGHFLGTYTLSQLPLVIPDFPAAGNTGNVKVCINDNPNCCSGIQFNAPDCSTSVPCEIYDIAIQTGDCHSDGTYDLKLDFKVADPTNDLFEVWAGNKYLGHFPLNQLPLTLNFPWGGGPVDVIKICINDNPNCCKVKEFLTPDCFNPCQIRNLRIDTDSCTSDSTYALKFAFDAPTGVDSFGVWTTSGQFLGRFAVADMPISLSDFPWGGGTVDGIRVCISNSCCREKEFNVPDCLAPPCGITDLTVKTGACTSPKTYKIELNFVAVSPVPTATHFSVWADNGDSLGIFSISDLPLGLNFPWNGDKKDALKVCLLDADGNELCCKIIRFDAPDCVGVQCGIFNLTVETGDCNADGSYQIVVNFQTPAASLSKFGIWSGTGQFFGFFQVSDLPLKINNFKPSGGSLDKIIICFGSGCCAVKEFNPPDCAGNNSCGIVDLTAVPGDCNDDGTYQLKINFQLLTLPPGNVQFSVYAANGQFLGTYSTGDLPVVIQHFPWNGNAVDVVKICIGNTAGSFCCRVKEFKAPDCTGAPCGIFDLSVKTGDCNPDGTYHIWVDFKTTSAAGAFGITAGNGQFLGVYTFGSLPVHIPNFPASGKAVDVVKVCLISPTNTTPPCCLTKEFKAPDCAGGPCDIYDLKVETGDCASDSTYHVWINFKVNHPGTSTLFAVYANGNLYGQFPLSDLPLHIPDFPYNGGPNDVVKICIVSPLTVLCCETKEFPVPDCLNSGPCDIYDFVVDPGGCTSDSTYKLFLNFKVKNPGAGAKFGVWANGKLLGYYGLGDLPLTINDFPWGGGDIDVVKVCIVTSNAPSTTCCATKEIHAPDCMMHQCEIYDLKVETGKCNDSGTAYEVWINFKVQNPPALSAYFGVWANGHFLGFFPLNQLPLYIPNFPTNGGPNDVVKICLSNTGTIGCCATKEFPVPDCVKGHCEIYDIVVHTGGCNDDGTYEIKLDFKVDNPGNDFFEVWAGNGKYLGYFPLKDLPLVISHFPWGGGAVDVIKICINDNPNCCRNFEFKVPDCVTTPSCHINDLTVKTGDCNDDGTYHAWVDFNVVSPSNNTVFGVWANGNFLGTYSLGQLPLHIEHFPTDGGPNDVVKVCILVPGTTQTLCCETKEFPVPGCLGGPCEIYDLKVETGDCNDDGTYHAWVNFKVANPGLFTLFGVWANGNFLGTHSLNDLPLHIEHFPTDGGPNDVIKVCIVGTSPNIPPACCRTIEFPVPDCLGNDCKIYDLQVQHTPCLCGQFFAILTFKHTGGGSGGFDIAGNGVLYGNYPYNTQQPIILGPLDGDAVTNYEFVVRDHLHPDCHDAVDLGIIDCSSPVQITAGTSNAQQSSGKLVLSPNPTSNWLSVTALLNTGAVVGQATVEIRQADGRLIRTLVVPDGGAFQLDVAELQAGVYRLSLQTAAARLDATFAKQ